MSTRSIAASRRANPDKMLTVRVAADAGVSAQSPVRVDDFDYHLPEELIALRPASPRDAARLLVVDPATTPPFADRMMSRSAGAACPGDALVFNDTKVIPAELRGVRERDGASAQISVTLIERLDAHRWQALARPAKRLKPGDRIVFGEESNVCLLGSLCRHGRERGEEGEVTLAFDLAGAALDEAIHAQGAMPLPPYIASRRAGRRARSQRLSDDLRARGGRRRRADRGAAFHRAAHAGACRAEAFPSIS